MGSFPKVSELYTRCVRLSLGDEIVIILQ